MSFKTWSLANPTKTYGYKHIQKVIRNFEGMIAEAQEALAKAEQGIVPEWSQKRLVDLSATSLFNSINISDIMTSAMYTELGLGKEEVAKRVKEQRAKRWEREAVEAEERQRNSDAIALKVEKEHRQKDIESYQETINELQEKLSDYEVDESLLTYSQYDEWGELVELLEHRLGVLIPYLSLDLETPVGTSQFFEVTSQELDLVIDTSITPGREFWRGRVSDGSVSFTRVFYYGNFNGAMVVPVVLALLRYLDHRWDYLIKRLESEQEPA